MRGSRSCDYDPELFGKVKGAVSIQQAAEYLGLRANRRGLCLCPFHHDTNPSLKLYPDGRGFYCFTCGAGGDQINFVARYHGVSNYAAARELAEAFHIPIAVPSSYRERREADLARQRRANLSEFSRKAKMFLTVYYGLLCEAIHEKNAHFAEGLQNVTWAQYMLEQVEQCPEEVYQDRKAVKKIEEVERRVIDWYIRIGPDGTISR